MGVSIWEGEKATAMVNELKRIGGNKGISDELKSAFLYCMNNVAWASSTEGTKCINALRKALYADYEPYSNTLSYKASNGVILSNTPGITIDQTSLGDFSQSISNNLLTMSVGTNPLRLTFYPDYDGATPPTDCMTSVRLKVSDLPLISQSYPSGVIIIAPTGGGLATSALCLWRSSNGKFYCSVVDTPTALRGDALSEISANTLYEFQCVYDGTKQTISINGNEVYNGSPSTGFTQNGGLRFFRNETDHGCIVNVEELTFGWN